MKYEFINGLLSKRHKKLHKVDLNPFTFALTLEDWRLLSQEENLISYRTLKKDKERSYRFDERMSRLMDYSSKVDLDE